MSTRLTNHIRGLIVKSALKATNFETQRVALIAEIKSFARSWIVDRQPQGWFDLIAPHPKDWFKQQIDLSVHWAKNPIQLLSDNSNCHLYQVDLDDPVFVAVSIGFEGVADALAPFYARAELLVEQRKEARSALSAFLQSQRTIEALVKAMPEIEPHIPTDLKPKSYPIVAPSNALALLARMGFDQTVATA